MLRKIIHKLRYLIEMQKRQSTAKITIKELKKNDNHDIRKIGGVFDFIISNTGWTKDEKVALNKVSKLEKKYLNSSTKIDTIDYGAGTPDTENIKETQEKGIRTVQKIADIHKIASSKKKWGRLIFKIIREFKPINCLELGTSLGISASYQILALKLNGKGNLTTIEGSKERAKIANESLKGLDYKEYQILTGKFSDVLPNILNQNKLIDFAFIDGHHNKNATQGYFELLYPYLSNTSILIFDDINWSNEMKSVWKDISNDPKISVSFDLYNWGICLINKDKEAHEKSHFELSI